MNGNDLKAARGLKVIVTTERASYAGVIRRTTPTTIELVGAQDVTRAPVELGGALVIAARDIQTIQIRGA